MESQHMIALASGLISVVGTATASYLGYKAKQAESRLAEKLKTVEVSAGTAINERQEAAQIRRDQQEEIVRLRGWLDAQEIKYRQLIESRDSQIDQLQDQKRELQAILARHEFKIQLLEQEIARLKEKHAND